jgi:hypothetical protein
MRPGTRPAGERTATTSRRPTTQEANAVQPKTRAPVVVLVYAAFVAAMATLVMAPGRRPPPAAPPPPAAEFDEPPAEVAAVFERIMAKAAVARAVLADRLSLPEAAAVFGWLNRLPPAEARRFLRLPDGDFEASSDEEFLCLSVVVWVAQEADIAPADAHAGQVARAVKGQFRRAFADGARVALPAVVESDCRELVARVRAAAEGRRASGPYEPPSVDGLRLVESRFAGVTAFFGGPGP